MTQNDKFGKVKIFARKTSHGHESHANKVEGWADISVSEGSII